jgi:hypothetical protein
LDHAPATDGDGVKHYCVKFGLDPTPVQMK